MEDYLHYVWIGGLEGMEEHEMFLAEQAGEIAAENAWLIAAETPTAEDHAFEQWELSHGCAADPQSGYC